MDKITNRNEMFVKRLCNTIKHLSEVTILSTGFVCWLSGCSRAPTHQETHGDVSQEGAVSVYVFNYQLKDFAERIGGEHVRVAFPAPADEGPAFWRPHAETIAAYQQVLNAHGEVKNDYWRFSFGRMFDLFGPINPSTVNMGLERGRL